ncbi:hypothetical protein A2U01_0095472, partial [Trifolium medium]|nr:hypothetical protein [Trifolium medium]
CPVIAPLWGLVRTWIGMSSADPISLQDHFLQFIHSSGARIESSPLVPAACLVVLHIDCVD